MQYSYLIFSSLVCPRATARISRPHWMMLCGDYLHEIGYAAHKIGLNRDNVSDVQLVGRHVAAKNPKDTTMDQKTVRKLEKEVEEAIAHVIVERMGLQELPLSSNRAT